MSASKKFRNRIDRLTGRAKTRFGQSTDNPRLRDEGRTDEVRARIRTSGERLKDAFRGR